MTADTLPDEVDFVFCPEALPEEQVHRIVLVVEGIRVGRLAGGPALAHTARAAG